MATSQKRGRWLAAFLLTGTGLLLASCSGSGLSRTFGLTRDSPDAFAVTTRAPLSMPPDFTLRPPRPGAPRPMEQSARTQAQEALVPQTALGTPGSAGVTPGQEALIQQAGPPAPAHIRRTIEADERIQESDQGFFDRLMFWKRPQPHGILVDPQKEAKRLRENAALGESPENGDTPIIQPHRKGLLEGLF